MSIRFSAIQFVHSYNHDVVNYRSVPSVGCWNY